MKRIVRWPLALFAIALFAMVALSHDARAGSLQIRDEAHVLSVGDAARLRSAVGAAPFDARLVFTEEYSDGDDLLRKVGSLVNEPNVVAVGVDPRHRHVEVYFGDGTRIARESRAAIERAGNGAFREGKWEEGAAAVFQAASAAVVSAPDRALPARSPSFAGSGLFLLALVAGVIGVVALVARRRTRDDPSGTGYGPGPYGRGPYGGAPYGGPGYPAPPAGGGIGPLGGGLVGAGLGGLAGYELGKLEGEREERDREIGPDGGIDADRGAGGADDFGAGGGGSSWGDGDDGGGGSDSGGGFDGGGDSGGGSDF